MAFNLWKMLGLEKKGAPDYTAVTQAVRPFQSLTEIPMGATLNEQILAALRQGKGIGFAPEYAERTTSPLVATREARWKQFEQPALMSELASRGLSRSTLGARDIGLAEAAKERDINEIIGQAYKEQEAQKKLDEARFQELGMRFTGGEAAQKGIYSAEDVRRAEISAEAENRYRTEKEAERIADINKTIGLAVRGAGYAFAPMTAGASIPISEGIAGGFGGSQYNYGELLDLAKQAKGATTTTESPSPFISKKPWQTAYDYFRNLKS